MPRPAMLFAAVAIAALGAFLITAPAATPPAAASAALSISGTITLDPLPLPPGGSAETVECVVFLVPLDGSSGENERQWCDGYTIANLAPGSYLVLVAPHAASGSWAAAWHGGTPYQSEATVVTVTDSPVTGIDVHLPRAGSISGHVSIDGPAPVGEVWIAAQLKDPNTGSFDDRDIAAVDPATGRYVLDGLAVGEYALHVFDLTDPPAYADAFSGDASSLESASLVSVAPAATTDGGEIIFGETPSISVDRIAGADRFETSAALSRAAFQPGVPVVFVSTGLNWPDALSAGPAAAHLGGPLLLVAPDHVPQAIVTELDRLDPDVIVVTGGEASVSAGVFAELGAYAPTIERVAGADRYETSRAIVRRAFGDTIPSRRIFIATGTRFPDALSAGAAAASADAPVLLVNGSNDWIDQPTQDLLFPTIFQSMTVVGGTASIGPTAASQLRSYTTLSSVTRIGGVDRYDTSRLLAAWSFTTWAPDASGRALLSTGEGFADALAGIPLAGLEKAPIVLSPPHCVPSETLATLRHLRTTELTFLGGPATLPTSLEGLPTC